MLCWQANRDAGIREAECERSAMDVKYSTGENIQHRVHVLNKYRTGKKIVGNKGTCIVQVRVQDR